MKLLSKPRKGNANLYVSQRKGCRHYTSIFLLCLPILVGMYTTNISHSNLNCSHKINNQICWKRTLDSQTKAEWDRANNNLCNLDTITDWQPDLIMVFTSPNSQTFLIPNFLEFSNTLPPDIYLLILFLCLLHFSLLSSPH